MTLWLRTLAALVEDPGLVPSPYTAAHNHPEAQEQETAHGAHSCMQGKHAYT